MQWMGICMSLSYHITAAFVRIWVASRDKPQFNVVIEPIDLSKMAPISLSLIFEVFHNLCLWLMCICMSPYLIIAALYSLLLSAKCFIETKNFGYHPELNHSKVR